MCAHTSVYAMVCQCTQQDYYAWNVNYKEVIHTLTYLCSLQVYIWLFLVGYLLATGTVLAKMCRVYQIFHNPAPNKKV